MAATAKVRQLSFAYALPASPSAHRPRLACAACQAQRATPKPGARIARYPTLCFDCFKREVERLRARHGAARCAMGRTARDRQLDRATTYRDLDRRRRLAQIAARHVMEAWEA